MNKQRKIERRNFLKQLSAATLGLGLVPAGPLGSFALGQTPGFNRLTGTTSSAISAAAGIHY